MNSSAQPRFGSRGGADSRAQREAQIQYIEPDYGPYRRAAKLKNAAIFGAILFGAIGIGLQAAGVPDVVDGGSSDLGVGLLYTGSACIGISLSSLVFSFFITHRRPSARSTQHRAESSCQREVFYSSQSRSSRHPLRSPPNGEGFWKSVDETGKATAYWDIHVVNGKLMGEILKIVGESDDTIASDVKPSYKDFPVAGRSTR